MHRDGVGIGPGREQPTAIGRERDVARKSSAHRLHLDHLQHRCCRIGAINRDRVVAAIRRVNKLPAGVDQNLGGGVKRFLGLHRFTERRHGRDQGCRARRRIPSEGRDRQRELVQQIDKFSVRRKLHVPGSAAGDRRNDPVHRDGRRREVDPMHHDCVHPEIGHEGESAVR